MRKHKLFALVLLSFGLLSFIVTPVSAAADTGVTMNDNKPNESNTKANNLCFRMFSSPLKKSISVSSVEDSCKSCTAKILIFYVVFLRMLRPLARIPRHSQEDDGQHA